MEADRQAELDRRFPQRIPVRVTNYRLAERLWLASKEDAAMTHRRAASHLGHRRLHVPERCRGDRQQAARIGRRPFALPVVVDLHAGQHQFRVAELQEHLAAEAADIGIHDHRPDAHPVHVGEPRLGVKGAGMHVFVRVGWGLHVADPGGGRQAEFGDRLAVQEPHLSPASVRGQLRHCVTHVGRHAAGPQIGRFGDVGVDVDDAVCRHALGPAEN